MKKLQTFSFHLHWITLCCFLLPFFYDSCADKKTEDASVDSTSVVVPVDTTLEDSISSKNTFSDSTSTTSIDTIVTESTNQKDALLSEIIIKKYPILALILIPKAGTHTGLATVVNSLKFLPLFAATITFILLIISLLAKLIDKNAIKVFLLLEICSIAFLIIASPPFFDHNKLWGYWLCMTCISILILIDTIIICRQKCN